MPAITLPRWTVGAPAVMRRRLQREARRWGLPGLLAGVLGAAALWLLAIELPRGEAALREDEVRWIEARAARVAAQRRTAATMGTDAAHPARRFVAAFPAVQERHRRIERLLAMATVMGLQPRRGDVRDAPGGASGLARVRFVMPLNGGYESLRRYVDLALREDPALTLDLLRIERPDGQQAELRVELQWSLWMRPAPPAVGGGPR
ncbi:hypothetical protein [Variovorax sp. YR752]|uniref:hypothetical protein n=1 Tax=Variovorax sp. YR752 TaxID=1884383 RepID=UPI003137C8B9